jgi:hypothetical protein
MEKLNGYGALAYSRCGSLDGSVTHVPGREGARHARFEKQRRALQRQSAGGFPEPDSCLPRAAGSGHRGEPQPNRDGLASADDGGVDRNPEVVDDRRRSGEPAERRVNRIPVTPPGRCPV